MEAIQTECFNLMGAASAAGVSIGDPPIHSEASELRKWIADTSSIIDDKVRWVESQDIPARVQSIGLLKDIMASTPDPNQADFVKRLKQMYWGSTSDRPLSATMPSPDSEDIFDYLEESGRIIDLTIKFGQPDEQGNSEFADHSEVIQQVSFEGAYSQSSIDDRNTNQISYPFFGRCLSGVWRPV